MILPRGFVTRLASSPRVEITLTIVTVGYSGTPLASKLGVKVGHRVMLIGASRDWLIEELPSKVRILRRRSGVTADVVISFYRNADSLHRDLGPLANTIKADGSLWTAWPRRAGGHTSDITDNVVRAAMLPLGLVDVKVAALDDDWSVLKMMWRKELRADRR